VNLGEQSQFRAELYQPIEVREWVQASDRPFCAGLKFDLGARVEAGIGLSFGGAGACLARMVSKIGTKRSVNKIDRPGGIRDRRGNCSPQREVAISTLRGMACMNVAGCILANEQLVDFTINTALLKGGLAKSCTLLI
jgi:hypothetical protein